MSSHQDFLRHNVIFFSGSLVVSVLNYFFYPVLGRLLPTAGFGELQAVMTLFVQTTIFLMVVSNVAVNIVANEDRPDVRSRIVGEIEQLASIIVVAGLAIGLALLPWIQNWLHFNHPLPFIILGAAIAISVPLNIRQAYLRGVRAFTPVSISGVISAGAKLVASAVFVLIGFGVAGAIGGVVAGQLIALVYAARYARRLGLHLPTIPKFRWPDLAVIKPQLPYTALVLIVSLVTTIQFSFDILVVKHYFSPETAGAYAGVATIARIIYFLTGSIAGVLLASVKLDQKPKESQALLLKSIGFQTLLGGSALLAFTLFPAFFIHLLIGPRYLELAHLLPMLSLALFIVALIYLLLTYDLALRRWSAAIVAVAGAIIIFVTVAISHATPAAVVQSLLLGSVLMLGLRLLDTVRRRLQTGAGPRDSHQRH